MAAPRLVHVDLRGGDPRARAAAVLPKTPHCCLTRGGAGWSGVAEAPSPECGRLFVQHPTIDLVVRTALAISCVDVATETSRREYYEYAPANQRCGSDWPLHAYWSATLGGTMYRGCRPTSGAPLEMTHRGANFAFELDGTLAAGLEQRCSLRGRFNCRAPKGLSLRKGGRSSPGR